MCFLQDIVSRHLAERSATEDQMPRLGPAVWAAGSQSELTPSESLTTSDAVRETLLLPSMAFSHFFFSPPFSCFHVALVLLKPFIPHCHPSPSLSFLHFIIPFFNFSLGLISFHPTSSCLLSLFHVPLYFLTLIFPPRSSLSLSLTWRHASEVFFQKRKKRKEKKWPCSACASVARSDMWSLFFSRVPRVVLIGSQGFCLSK